MSGKLERIGIDVACPDNTAWSLRLSGERVTVLHRNVERAYGVWDGAAGHLNLQRCTTTRTRGKVPPTVLLALEIALERATELERLDVVQWTANMDGRTYGGTQLGQLAARIDDGGLVTLYDDAMRAVPTGAACHRWAARLTFAEMLAVVQSATNMTPCWRAWLGSEEG